MLLKMKKSESTYGMHGLLSGFGKPQTVFTFWDKYKTFDKNAVEKCCEKFYISQKKKFAVLKGWRTELFTSTFMHTYIYVCRRLTARFSSVSMSSSPFFLLLPPFLPKRHRHLC
jgi:hypothetical protein